MYIIYMFTEGVFVFGLTGAAFLVGFTTSVKAAQKKDPQAFSKVLYY